MMVAGNTVAAGRGAVAGKGAAKEVVQWPPEAVRPPKEERLLDN